MEIYGLKNCDKCRMAHKALDGYDIIDVKNVPISDEILQAAFLTFGEKLINRNSTTWRGMNDTEKRETPLALLRKYPTLMKRPLIKTAEGRLFIGWSEAIKSEVSEFS